MAKTREPRDPVEERIRENLVRFVAESKYSHNQIADLAGIPQASFGRYLRGENAVQAQYLKVLAQLFGRSVDDFYSATPPPADPTRVPLVFFKALPGTELTEDDWHDIEDLNARVRARHAKKKSSVPKR